MSDLKMGIGRERHSMNKCYVTQLVWILDDVAWSV